MLYFRTINFFIICLPICPFLLDLITPLIGIATFGGGSTKVIFHRVRTINSFNSNHGYVFKCKLCFFG